MAALVAAIFLVVRGDAERCGPGNLDGRGILVIESVSSLYPRLPTPLR